MLGTHKKHVPKMATYLSYLCIHLQMDIYSCMFLTSQQYSSWCVDMSQPVHCIISLLAATVITCHCYNHLNTIVICLPGLHETLITAEYESFSRSLWLSVVTESIGPCVLSPYLEICHSRLIL